jgi:hypothetical protein
MNLEMSRTLHMVVWTEQTHHRNDTGWKQEAFPLIMLAENGIKINIIPLSIYYHNTSKTM